MKKVKHQTQGKAGVTRRAMIANNRNYAVSLDLSDLKMRNMNDQTLHTKNLRCF